MEEVWVVTIEMSVEDCEDCEDFVILGVFADEDEAYRRAYQDALYLGDSVIMEDEDVIVAQNSDTTFTYTWERFEVM